MDNVEKGRAYEVFINAHINSLPKTKISYLWSDVPEQVLFDANLITDYNKHRLKRKNKEYMINGLKDVGIDIVKINDLNQIVFIQCKNYSNTLQVGDLSGFLIMMLEHGTKNGYVYHSTNKISLHIKEHLPNRIKLVHKPMIVDEEKPDEKVNEVELYDYQKDVLKLYQEYYKTEKKAILSMPCGTGKTITSLYISKEYQTVVFISPLKQFAEQNMVRYKSYDTSRACLLVDSDGTRDVKEIQKFVKQNKKTMLSVTYKSVDVIISLMEYMVNPFIIIDEFHNLSATNIYGLGEIDEAAEDTEDDEEDVQKDPLNVLINSDYKMLFMSATPRVYELEDNNDCYVEDILGKMVYKMDFKTAIEKKYITDYNIYLPIMEDESKSELDGVIEDIEAECDIVLADAELSQKCCYLYECMKKLGTLKCIIYFRSHEEIKQFIKYFDNINKYYAYEYRIDSITCDDHKQKRNDKINKFKKAEGNAFLCAVNILDECIDIAECNSIYVTYNCKSKVKNVQRMSRAMRLNGTNDKKKASVILWCSEIDDMLTYMSSIKEIDLNYSEKIRYVQFNRGLVKEVVEEMGRYKVKYGKKFVGLKNIEDLIG